ncbi:MAG: hypothetical protein R3B70_35630 [Polyangiaceae bacterium]
MMRSPSPSRSRSTRPHPVSVPPVPTPATNADLTACLLQDLQRRARRVRLRVQAGFSN